MELEENKQKSCVKCAVGERERPAVGVPERWGLWGRRRERGLCGKSPGLRWAAAGSSQVPLSPECGA